MFSLKLRLSGFEAADLSELLPTIFNALLCLDDNTLSSAHTSTKEQQLKVEKKTT